MTGHLGARVSALLDDQLSTTETEASWAHVHGCHACRDLVERESWLKRRVSGLSHDPAAQAPMGLKGSLLDPAALAATSAAADDPWGWGATPPRPRGRASGCWSAAAPSASP